MLQKYRQDFTYETIPSLVLEMKAYIDQHFKEIAVDVGLENYAYFSRLFKKRTGLTPSQYRKSGF